MARYFPEQGHVWNVLLCNAERHDISSTQTALVEVVAGLCRMERSRRVMHLLRSSGRIVPRAPTFGLSPLLFIPELETGVAPIAYVPTMPDNSLVPLHCVRYTLTNQAPLPTFVCADACLLAVASAAGLPTKNPDNHQ